MLTIPSVLEHSGVTVFPDDEDCNLFYLIPSTPKITKAADGTPIFSGHFWTDKADGSSDSVAGLAGGWINFDVNLAIDQTIKDEIKELLDEADVQKARRKEIIKQEKERLGRIAKARGTSAVPDPDVLDIAEIRFGSVQYTEGSVSLLEEKDGDIVEWSSAGGPPSMIGDNNATFALRLSPEGAAIWYNSLREDAKAFSVVFNLTYMVRLQSLTIKAWAASSQSYEMNRKVDRVWKNVDKGCSDADVERINVREITENLMEESLVQVEIKKSSTEISDEYVSELRNMMVGLIDDKVKEIIKSRIHGMTEEERKNSMLELIQEEINSFVELNFSQSDVIEWKVAPQATIMGFLENVPEEKKKHITKLIDLSNPIVSTIELPIQVSAPWDEAPFVEAVKVDLEYPAANKRHTALFKKGDEEEIWRLRRPKGDDGVVKYTTEVYFKGKSKPYRIPEQTTNGAINVSVGKVGLIDVNFRPHPVLSSLTGNNRITAVQVDTWFKDSSDPQHFQTSVVFTLDDFEGKKVQRFIGAPIDAPLQYQVRYFTKGGDTIQMPTLKYYLSENDRAEIYTPSPFEDTLEIGIELAITPNDSLKKIIVEFEYKDEENNFECTDKVILSEEDDWESVMASLVLMDKEKRDFRYRYKVLSENNVSRSKWIEANGDQALVLPILQVMIDVSRLDLGDRFSNAILDLNYHDEANRLRVNNQLFFAPGDTFQRYHWYIPRMDANLDTYTYSLILYDNEGGQMEINDLEGKGRFLIVRVPETIG